MDRFGVSKSVGGDRRWSLPWLGLVGVGLVFSLVLVQGPLGQIAARYEGIGFETPGGFQKAQGAFDDSSPSEIESTLARLEAATQTKPPLEALLLSNEALESTLRELQEAHGRVQRKLQVLLATSARRDAIIGNSLEGRGNDDSGTGGAAGVVLTPEDKELAGKNLEKLAARKALELLPQCLALREEHDTKLKNLIQTWHAWASAVRENKYRNVVWQKVDEMDQEKEWWKGLAFPSGREAVQRLQTLEGDERQKLDDFLLKYLPNEALYNVDDPEVVARTHKWREEGESLLQSRLEARNRELEEVRNLEAQLLELCGIQFPLSDWMDAHDAICDNFTSASKELHFAGYSDCVDWSAMDPEYRQRLGIAAPAYLWQEDPKLYVNPSVNVTFILQYFRQAELIPAIVDRLYRCTEGKKGQGQFPGLTTTLLVNVDQPEEFQTWYDEWKRTDEGSFLVPVFSHNVHENRGFNNLARAARGEFVIFIQDNDVPPEDCQWLQQALKVFQAWPRVGAVGLRNEKVSAAKFDRAGVLGDLHIQGSKDYTPKRLHDPEINVRMHFASVADVGPLAVRKDLFHSLGGFHEGFCKKGNPCSLADWQLTFRVWLAGYQVVHVELDDRLSFSAGPNAAAPGLRELATALQNVKVNFEASTEIYKEHRDYVVKEVKRMNSHLPEALHEEKPSEEQLQPAAAEEVSSADESTEESVAAPQQ